jgi:hypothetical protein
VRERSIPVRERDPSPAPSRSIRSPPPRASRYEEPRSRAHRQATRDFLKLVYITNLT